MRQEQKEILSYIVTDPDAWDEHQRAHFIKKHGEVEGSKIADDNLNAKVLRWKPQFERLKGKPEYKTRAEREK